MRAVIKYGLSFMATFGFVVAIIYRLIGKKPTPVNKICEIIFTNPSSICCLNRRNKIKPCINPYCIEKCANRILYYIDSARSNICLAMNIFTYQPFCEALVNAQKRGVTVRVIFDGTMAGMSESKRPFLEKNGIAVKLFDPNVGGRDSDHSMHHKFCLIDVLRGDEKLQHAVERDGVLIVGSLNWTTNALSKNWENFLISSDQQAAQKFKNEFEVLWCDSKIPQRKTKNM